MENRMRIEVMNNSEHTFVFDGEWLRSGEWKSDRWAPLRARELAVVELFSAAARGVAGVVWFTDEEAHDVYLSMAMANPRLRTASFSCSVGVPPANLKFELDVAQKLCQGQEVSPEGAGCSWTAAAVGALTVVRLVINDQLEHYVPAVASAAAPPAEAAAAPTAPPGGRETQERVSVKNLDTGEVWLLGREALAGGGMNQRSSTAPILRRWEAPPETRDVAIPSASSSDNVTKEHLDKFIAQTRPKDAIDGFSRGVKTAGTGLVAGVGNVVASSVHGAQSGGGLGFAKGLITGVGVGAAIAVGGTACCVAQIGRGIVNTPAAFRGRREQRVWDGELGKWVDIDLIALERKVLSENSDEEDDDCNPSVDVVETEYYDLMGVRTSASPSEIKKAYYKEARQCHPDKNPGDSEAKVKFQKLADAYQVLSDPASRRQYDREGKAGIEEGSVNMDPQLFFSLLFGSERFEPWIGELHLAMQTDQFTKALEKEGGGDDGSGRSAEEVYQEGEATARKLKRRQHRREVRCACHLRDKLDRHVYGRDERGWDEQMRLEAAELANGQFGPELLGTLGDMYQLRAEIYMADELVGRFSLTKRVASIRHSGHTIRHRMLLVRGAAGSLLRAKKVHDVAMKLQGKEKNGEASATAGTAEDEVRWTVRIDRSTESPLGIKLIDSSLEIEEVLDSGLFAEWNKAVIDKDTVVRKGDRIVDVNGMTSPPAIIGECQQRRALHVGMSRTVEAPPGSGCFSRQTIPGAASGSSNFCRQTTPEEAERPDEEHARKAVEDAIDDALPMFLQTAWAAVVTDIDGTMKEVGRKLLKDKAVPWQIRIRRAQALQRLGQIFTEEGAKAAGEQGGTASRVMTSEAAKATLQEALSGSVREKR